MKLISAFILCIFVQCCFAQKILVPYRSGKLFGLSDQNGKLVLKPAFDNVEWLSGTWFRTSKKIELKDTLETAPNRFFIQNGSTTITGLVNNGKVILADEPFDEYEIIAKKCIVTEFQGRGTDLTKEQFKKYGDKRRFYCLFNLQGKNLYPENFRRIQKMDTAGKSSRYTNEARYVLFAVTSFNDRYSLLVFDADKQEISDWLVKDANKIEPDRYSSTNKQMVFNITDKDFKRSTQFIDNGGEKFVLKPTAADGGNGKMKQGREESMEVKEVSIGGGFSSGNGPDDNVAVPMDEKQVQTVYKFNPYHLFVKDSLFYITSDESKQPVKLQPGAKVIFAEPRGMTQYQPVMVTRDNHFYIVNGEKTGKTAYDSLIYFGKYFLAWQKINGQIKAGVINADGSIAIPFQFDSLYAGIRYLELVDQNPAGRTPQYKIVFREADSKYTYSKTNPYTRGFDHLLTGFANGKAGVINIMGEVVIPFNYQLIARNSMSHMMPRESEFILLKQDGKYGLTTLQNNREKKHDTMSSSTIPPAFEYIPGFYFRNYYGIKKYKLIGLYNEQFNFMGYGMEGGKVFYENQ